MAGEVGRNTLLCRCARENPLRGRRNNPLTLTKMHNILYLHPSVTLEPTENLSLRNCATRRHWPSEVRTKRILSSWCEPSHLPFTTRNSATHTQATPTMTREQLIAGSCTTPYPNGLRATERSQHTVIPSTSITKTCAFQECQPERMDGKRPSAESGPVSYTHLTLPTSD